MWRDPGRAPMRCYPAASASMGSDEIGLEKVKDSWKVLYDSYNMNA